MSHPTMPDGPVDIWCSTCGPHGRLCDWTLNDEGDQECCRCIRKRKGTCGCGDKEEIEGNGP